MATMDGKHMTKDKALDLALEALELYGSEHAKRFGLEGAYDEEKTKGDSAITAIKQARSAPVQEPIALKPCWYESKEKTMCRKCGQVHAEAIPPAAQTATVLQQAYRTSDAYTVGFKDGQAAQRQWQSLTDEDREDAWRNALHEAAIGESTATKCFARAIEAKLKEKNT